MRLIDLSQEIYQGMPVFPMHQKTMIFSNMTHEECRKNYGASLGFATRNLLINEHGPTHSDALYETNPDGPTIDEMDINYFWGSAICLDVSHVPVTRYIEVMDLDKALKKSGLTIRKNDIVLLYTGNFTRAYGTKAYTDNYSGLNRESAKWICEKGAVNIGVDSPSIDHTADEDFSAHRICLEYKITNTENLCNLEKVAGKRFLYVGLPLRIRDGTGSPIRAVAFVED